MEVVWLVKNVTNKADKLSVITILVCSYDV